VCVHACVCEFVCKCVWLYEHLCVCVRLTLQHLQRSHLKAAGGAGERCRGMCIWYLSVCNEVHARRHFV
jgi:hypothetical protein